MCYVGQAKAMRPIRLLSTILLAALLAGGCAETRRTIPPTIDAEARTERDLVYARHDGEDLLADVYIPAGAEPHPAVLVVHGGAWRHGRRWYMSRICERLRERGYTVINVSYRLAPRHRFPQPLDDCRAAVRWMRDNATRFRIDPQRIGAFGYSAGGHLVALLALSSGEPALDRDSGDTSIQAAVIGAAPTELRTFPDTYPVELTVGRFLGGSPNEIPALYSAASPIAHVSADDPPMFLYHGASDWIVPVEQSRDMDQALALAGVPHQYHEGTLGHLTTFLFDTEAVTAAIAFLDHWLKEPSAQPAMDGPSLGPELTRGGERRAM